jgi:Ca2+-binding RTX toxin-like protein
MSALPFAFEALQRRDMFAAVVVNGTSGDDEIYLSVTGSQLNVNVNGAISTYTSVTSITVNAGTGDDYVNVGQSVTRGCTISGNSGNDVLQGGAGPDNITGNDGNDDILGGLGNNLINGNAGNDTLNGASGNDTLFGSTGADLVYGNGGTDYIYQNNSANDNDGVVDTLRQDIGATAYFFVASGDSSAYI